MSESAVQNPIVPDHPRGIMFGMPSSTKLVSRVAVRIGLRGLLLASSLGFAAFCNAATTNDVLGMWLSRDATNHVHEFLESGVMRNYFLSSRPNEVQFEKWSVQTNGDLEIIYSLGEISRRATIEADVLSIYFYGGRVDKYDRTRHASLFSASMRGRRDLPTPPAAPAPTQPVASAPAPSSGPSIVGVWSKDVGSGDARRMTEFTFCSDGTYEEFRSSGQGGNEVFNQGTRTAGRWTLSGSELILQYQWLQQTLRHTNRVQVYGETLAITAVGAAEAEVLKRTARRPPATVAPTGTSSDWDRARAYRERLQRQLYGTNSSLRN